jgi:hypothetical protein
VLLANTGNAQRKTLEEVKISVNLTDKSLSQFFRLVESKTDFKFTFSNNLVDLKRSVTVVAQDNSLYDILVSVSRQADVNFVQLNENIHVKTVSKTGGSVEVKKQLDTIHNILKDPSEIDRIEDYNIPFSKGNWDNLNQIANYLKKQKKNSL